MKNDAMICAQLVRRGLKVFLKDTPAVFFSLLAPLIILLLYILFLGDLQMQNMHDIFQGVDIEEKTLRAFVDSWMLAGCNAVACITVSFSAQTMMVHDRHDGIVNDFYAAPVKRSVIKFSYLLYNFCVTLVICSLVLVISFIYIGVSGWYLSVGDVFALIGLLIMSAASAALISTLVCSFLKSESAHSAFVGIMSAAIGFLIGAYMPLAVFPKAIQYIVLIFPGTYSAGAFRNLFMSGSLKEIGKIFPQAVPGLEEGYSLSLNCFDKTVNFDAMLIVLAVSILLFAALIPITEFLKKRIRFAKRAKNHRREKTAEN